MPEACPAGPVMLDVAGKSLTNDDIVRLRHPLTGGVILFSRNFESRSQLIALTAAIRAARPEILIAVDHEGGRVQRFRTDGFTHIPAMRRLGDVWQSDASNGAILATQGAVAAGYVLAAELIACGIDLAFTPVLDLDYGTSSVIGDRAFHHDPRVVALIAQSLNHGLALAGMANCGKHFPGHGFVAADSHHAVPVDERPLDQILASDARPYEWLVPALLAVMPAHVIYPDVDALPAGFSSFWLQNILRGKFGFTGAIFSDDLSMQAASVAGSVVEGAHAAIAAGCDMVLICNAPDRADELLDNLRWRPGPELFVRISALRNRSMLAAQRGVDEAWTVLRGDARYLKSKSILAGLGLIRSSDSTHESAPAAA